ncbi:hypothetical protein [Aulosira sp. FACHB-615]|uniref:hypothetical protein n=1 Tax=Aulosira sp. FACHB-615 TaxID=2692777 RepID=UPI001685AC6C|nr:hypothetical protein [Aulosira sp. FACHB-615]MBD2488833.1 hypothetical protein [Aulosira sp. FACHB-615]
MIIRYQADADLNQAIVTGVLRREPTIDFQTAFAAGLAGVKDPEVLAIALIMSIPSGNLDKAVYLGSIDSSTRQQ